MNVNRLVWMALFTVACAGGETAPGEIVCGEGTQPHGESCIPIEGDDTGDVADDEVWD